VKLKLKINSKKVQNNNHKNKNQIKKYIYNKLELKNKLENK
jgi:hypothetical protein